MEQLNWQYPTWYLLFCLILGVAAAVFLYRKDRTFQDQAAWLRYLMAFLRGLAVTMISSLLLAPLLRLLQTRSELPVILVAHDQSKSLANGMSPEDSATYVQALDRMIARLGEKYRVDRIGFGESTSATDSWTWDDKATDLGSGLQYIHDQYAGQPVGAIILASDGAVNKGRNPLYVPTGLKAPLHVVALGDTTRQTDIQIRDVLHNSIAYLGDKFVVQIDVAAMRLSGSTARLEVRKISGGQSTLLDAQVLPVDSDSWFSTREVTIEATESGIQRYRVQVSGLPGEITLANNARDFFVEVIDGRLNVLVLANSPHPDQSVWRSALQEQRNYTVDVKMAADFSVATLKDYDLVILHQIPSSTYVGEQLFSEIDRLRLPKIMVLGSQTYVPAVGRVQPFLSINGGGDRTPNEVTAILNPGFTAFKVPEELKSRLAGFTPLVSPYGEYAVGGGAQVLAWQRIGQVETQYPLIVLGEAQEIRTVVIAGEGAWHWQLFEQSQYGTRENTFELLSQLAQFASTKSDKRKFRVNMARRLYTDIEDVTFQAELYNDNYERINAPEARMKVRNGDGDEFDFLFTPTGDSYQLNIGRFPAGDYSFRASSELNGVAQVYDGKFTIQPVQLEDLTRAADHGLLRELADRNGGQYFLPGQLDALADAILTNEDIKPVLYSTTQTRPLIALKWLCLVLIAILGLEWFLRRYFGGY